MHFDINFSWSFCPKIAPNFCAIWPALSAVALDLCAFYKKGGLYDVPFPIIVKYKRYCVDITQSNAAPQPNISQ